MTLDCKDKLIENEGKPIKIYIAANNSFTHGENTAISDDENISIGCPL